MPDDALFPACARCQSISRDAEHLMSFLISSVNPTDAELQAWLRRHQSLVARFPDLLADIIPTGALKQDLLRQVSAPPPGFQAEHMIAVDSSLWAPIFHMFAKKIVLAMHYRALGMPLMPDGGLLMQLTPNAHFDAGWDDDFLSVTFASKMDKHGNQDLGDQITTRWSHSDAHGVFCCRMTLHRSVTVYGFTASDRGKLQIEMGNGVIVDGPFRWYHGRVTPSEFRGRIDHA